MSKDSGDEDDFKLEDVEMSDEEDVDDNEVVQSSSDMESEVDDRSEASSVKKRKSGKNQDKNKTPSSKFSATSTPHHQSSLTKFMAGSVSSVRSMQTQGVCN